MDIWSLFPWLMSMVLLVVFVLAKDMLMFKIKYILKKKRGGIPSICITEDKNVYFDVVSPGEDGRIREEEGETEAKTVPGESIYWFTPFDSRLVFERDGDSTVFDPYDEGSGRSITAATIDRVVKREKIKEALNKDEQIKQMRTLQMIGVIVAVITLVLVFLVMQGQGDIMNMIEPLTRNVAQAGETATKAMN